MADAVWWGWVVVACLSACLWIAGSEGGRRDGWMLGGCDRRCERGAVRTEHEHGTHHVDSEGKWHPSPSY